MFLKLPHKWQHRKIYLKLSYCKDPRTIILCVIPGNADLSTSDGLKFARDFDPAGERTIGVITKVFLIIKLD
jgi:hypothetical protein